jgi:hypothetical protein
MITNSTPQRALRGHMPQRPTPRIAASGEHHTHLAGRLTARDRWLARMLFEHRVFTTHQIVQLAFPSIRAANHRLRELYQWRVLDRFQPFVSSGTQPMHYVLDIAGLTALAFEDGLDPATLGYRHDRAIGIAYSLRLAHTVGTNGFFTALVHASRRPAAGLLTAWWSEARCQRHFGDIARPDAYGRWRDADTRTEVEFFLEFDYGTEPLRRLARKLADYERLATTTGITTPVLVWLPSTRRETTARRALTTALADLPRPALVPVATSSADLPIDEQENSPAAARWLPLTGTAPGQPRRTHLMGLAHTWPDLISPTPATVPPRNSPRQATASTELAAPEPLPPSQPRYRIHRPAL